MYISTSFENMPKMWSQIRRLSNQQRKITLQIQIRIRSNLIQMYQKNFE